MTRDGKPRLIQAPNGKPEDLKLRARQGASRIWRFDPVLYAKRGQITMPMGTETRLEYASS
jgi:hypothetical protein